VAELGQTIGEALLTPTRIYVRPVLALLRAGIPVHGMAHVTGGGLTGNLPRVLPRGCRAVLRRGAWRTPPIFDFLQRGGRIDEAEMFRVFNMGIGFVLIVPRSAVARARRALQARRIPTWEIGEVARGSRGVTLR
jgi:phosphoribosylformylglycinamidine cyclo-ligase